MTRILPILVGLWTVGHLGAQVDDPPDPLAHQATLITNPGKVYRGWLDGFRHDRVRLRLPADQGEVIYQFSGEEIRSLVFPGTDTIDEAIAMAEADQVPLPVDLLKTTWTLRAPYLPVLNRSNRAPLLLYAEVLLQDGRTLEGISRARRLAGVDLESEETERMDRVIIEGFEQAGLLDEASVLAEEWCLTHLPSGPSALGWAVLARIALREKNWEKALWFGLHPVAFGHDAAATGLADCYGATVAAALELGDDAEAVALVNEMRRRNIPWPREEPLLTEVGALIESALTSTNPEPETSLPDQAAGPPIPDPWLTLEAIRRVLAKPGS